MLLLASLSGACRNEYGQGRLTEMFRGGGDKKESPRSMTSTYLHTYICRSICLDSKISSDFAVASSLDGFHYKETSVNKSNSFTVISQWSISRRFRALCRHGSVRPPPWSPVDMDIGQILRNAIYGFLQHCDFSEVNQGHWLLMTS